jgi:uncharacterized protein
MFVLTELKKRPEGITFDRTLELDQAIKERNPEILDLRNVHVQGSISYDNGLYLLNYELTYNITMPSSRSMLPVEWAEKQLVSEVFIEEADVASKKDLVEEDLVLIVEGGEISLSESVLDNILLAIPLSVLTKEELESDELPSGNNWSVLTESQYQALQQEKKEENNPFASLTGLFDEE